MAMQAGFGVSKVVILIGAGLMGSVLVKNNGVSEFVTDISKVCYSTSSQQISDTLILLVPCGLSSGVVVSDQYIIPLSDGRVSCLCDVHRNSRDLEGGPLLAITAVC